MKMDFLFRLGSAPFQSPRMSTAPPAPPPPKPKPEPESPPPPKPPSAPPGSE